MENETSQPLVAQEAVNRVANRKSFTVFSVIWVLSTIAVIALIITLPHDSFLRLPIQLIFAASLLWYLQRSGPPTSDLPLTAPLPVPGGRFGLRLAGLVFVLAVVYGLGVFQHPWLMIVFFLTLLALVVLIRFRALLTTRLVMAGLAYALIVILSEVGRILPIDPANVNTFSLILNGLTVLPLFLAGGLLLEKTGLTRIQLVVSGVPAALRSFLIGCLLAVPAALANLNLTMQTDPWVDRWWKPLIALIPGIAEETWARLFLVSLAFFLLRPASAARPNRLLVTAVLVGALTHAAVHVPPQAIFSINGVMMLLVGGLLYGVPMGMLFIKRDFEHAAGYHFFIDFVRFIAAFLSG